MIELQWTLGEDGWLEQGNILERREALNRFMDENALDPSHLDEDWGDDRQLYAEIVALDAGRVVATAMLIIDPDHPRAPARIFGQAALKEATSPFLIESMEDALVTEAMLDPVFEHVEGTGGRLIPIPTWPGDVAADQRPGHLS